MGYKQRSLACVCCGNRCAHARSNLSQCFKDVGKGMTSTVPFISDYSFLSALSPRLLRPRPYLHVFYGSRPSIVTTAFWPSFVRQPQRICTNILSAQHWYCKQKPKHLTPSLPIVSSLCVSCLSAPLDSIISYSLLLFTHSVSRYTSTWAWPSIRRAISIAPCTICRQP